MIRRSAVFVCALLVSGGPAAAQDAGEPPPAVPRSPVHPAAEPSAAEPDTERAAALAARALKALRRGDAEEAARLFGDALVHAPDEPVLHYNLGVARARTAAGERIDGVSEAYREALRVAGRPGADDEVLRRALFNLGTHRLGEARGVADAIEGDETAPDGPAASPAEQQQEIGRGLEAAKDAVGRLRDLVRRDPADRDAVHNLELAQRVRKRLEEALERAQERQEQQQSDQDGESDDKERGDQSQKGDQEQEGDQQEESDQQQEGEGDDEQKPQEQPEASGDQEQGEGDEESSERESSGSEPTPQEMARDEAQRRLDQMLEAAARKARRVREMRAARLKRAPVEKDW